MSSARRNPVGWPDFTRPTAFVKQAVPIELIEQWQARAVEYFTIMVDSGTLASGTSTYVDTVVPTGETWFLYQVWGVGCNTLDTTLGVFEIHVWNYTKDLRFAAMTVSRTGFHGFPFALPFPCDAGDVIRTLFNNATGATQRYYAGIAGYKITASGETKEFRPGMSLDEFLDQPGVVGLFYELIGVDARLTVYNATRAVVDELEITDFQTPDEKVRLIRTVKIEERKRRRGGD